MPIIEMIIFSFTLAVVIFGIGFGLIALWNKIQKKEMIDIEFGDRKTSDIDWGYSKTIDDLPDEENGDEE